MSGLHRSGPPRCLLAAVLLLVAFGAGATEVEATAQARLGLRVTRLHRIEAPSELPVTAQVMDPGKLVGDAGQVEVAAAAAQASSAEARRSRALMDSGNASRKTWQAAQAAAVADQVALRQARLQLRLDAGGDVASMDDAALHQWLDRLVAGSIVLLRAEPMAPVPTGFAARSVRLRSPGGRTAEATVLGAASQSRSGLAAGWLLQAEGGALVPGMALTGQMPGEGPPRHGVLLPRSAIVRWNGVDWAYVMTDATHFERRAVPAPVMLPSGWLVGAPFAAGDKVVTQGAQALIAVDAAPLHAADAAPVDDD